MLLSELVAELDIVEVRGDSHAQVTQVVHDTAHVVPGAMYCCVPGTRADGHDFAGAAVASGATALLVERFVDVEVPQVKVASVRRVMGRLASRVHGDPSRHLSVFGVTGTNGKTTTTFLLEAVIRASGSVPGVIGTIEARIDGAPVAGALTTPEAPELHALLERMRGAGVDAVAMEVSSHALAYHRVEGVHFRAATFTNLSRDHLDFHGSLDEYFEAKARLFEPSRTDVAVVNVDDPWGRRLRGRCTSSDVPVVGFSLTGEPEADVTVSDVISDASGNQFTLRAPRWGIDVPVHSPLLGRFNVVNAAAAAATALVSEVSAEVVVTGLEAPVRVPGRFEPVKTDPCTVVVDYAHTPDALAHVLDAAREIAGEGRVLAVFGCGGDRDPGKRPDMGRVVAERADRIYVTSDNPRSEDPHAIIDQVVAGIPSSADPVVEPDRRGAIALALAAARPGDLVVVAGKGHETGQIVGDDVFPFDDRIVVEEEWETLGCG